MDFQALLALLRELLGNEDLAGDDLSILDDEQLREFELAAEAAFRDEREAGTLEAERATALVEAAEAIREEAAARMQTAADRDAELDALAARIAVQDDAEGDGDAADDADGDAGTGDADDAGDGAEGGSGDGEGDADGDAQTQAPPQAAAPAADEPPADEPPQRLAASARRRAVPRPRSRPAAPAHQPARLLAAGDLGDVSAGQPIDGVRQLGELFAEKAEALMGTGRTGKVKIARMLASAAAENVLTPENVQDRFDDIRKAGRELRMGDYQVRPTAMVAGGGICAPPEVRYEFMTLGDTDRPLRDGLPRQVLSRGGMTWVPPAVLWDPTVQGAIGTTTEAQDAARNTTKPCAVIQCADPEEIKTQAIHRCVEIGNFDRITFPEHFQEIWDLTGVAFARTAETELWDAMTTAATANTAHAGQEGIGAVPDLLATIARNAAAFRNRHRISMNRVLRAVFPDWTLELMRTDLARQQTGDGLERYRVSDAEILSWFAARGIAAFFIMDGQEIGGVQGAGPLIGWPDQIEYVLYPEGTFVFGDTGRLDFGTEIRDTTMIEENNVRAFMETFETLIMLGPEANHVTVDICANGLTAGTLVTSEAIPDWNPCGSGS